MTEEVCNCLDKFEEQTRQRFHKLYVLIYESTSQSINEKLWAKLPSFYVKDNFIRIIPFKDHINIEAKAVLSRKGELGEYKITPKGMLQIYHNQAIPEEILKAIFRETLEQKF